MNVKNWTVTQQLVKVFRDMKVFEKVIVCLLIMLGLFGGCAMINERLGLPNDNVFESKVEDVIEHYTGIDIDLTPEDPDENRSGCELWPED